MDSLSFKGKADIIFSDKLFNTAKKGVSEVCPFLRYRFMDAKFCNSGYSEHANTCTAGFVHNGKEGFMFHIAPEFMEETSAKFLNVVERLRLYARENLTAFITGGRDQFLGEEGKASFKAFDKIANALDHPAVDLSIIWGKKNTEFVDNLLAFTNGSKIVMKPTLIKKPVGFDSFLNTKYKNVKPLIANDIAPLEDAYSIVEINPKHNIFFDV